MSYRRIDPPNELCRLIECYWIIDNPDTVSVEQKIIPDGFPEIILHYGDPFMIRLGSEWELQSRYLVAGQITRHFYLKNTGVSQVLGIKLKPTALARLYGIATNELTDKVVDIGSIRAFQDFLGYHNFFLQKTYEQIVFQLNQLFLHLNENIKAGPTDDAIELINVKKGMIAVRELSSMVFLSERQLERLFKKNVGISPKLYCRIIRFNYIFQSLQNKDDTWAEIFYDAGFYDQSHFIRNFKDFTGEEPSSYLFQSDNLANFFLQRKAHS